MKIPDRQCKKYHYNSQGNKHLESDWEQQILIKLFKPFFCFVLLDYGDNIVKEPS